MLSQLKLKEHLKYDQETGKFIWIKPTTHMVSEGDEAGTICKEGYCKIQIFGKIYKRSRLAWLYVYGEFPVKHIDHINRDRLDDRISNLRDVSNLENNRNKKYKPSSSGVTGVLWYKRNSKWVAKIRVEGKLLHLGYFYNLEDAIKVRKEAEIKYNFKGEEL